MNLTAAAFRRGGLHTIVTVLLLVVAIGAEPARANEARGSRPTIVLVHGAWDTVSSWDGVASRLRDRGYTVLTPRNPLRSLRGDAAAIADVLRRTAGPIVLVGHSYGGAVITNAAAGNSHVLALVYIAAFAPDKGETTLGLLTRTPGSLVVPALVPTPYAMPDGGIGIETRINPLLFHSVFAQDVPRRRAAAMAASQGLTALSTGSERSGPPAWRQIPSWYLIPTQDRVIPPATERFMASRAGSHQVEVNSSHAVHVSHPEATTDLILAAAKEVS